MTRFEDTLRRDLHVIADRATPSSDAWDSILSRIADPAPVQETEIIMLTDNTTPTRRWPLVAAAAAVALAVGAIVSFGTGDDEQIPADPVPSVQPSQDDIEADTTPRPVSAGGTATSVSEFSELDATGAGTYTGTTSFEGDLTGIGTETGTYTMSADGNSSEATATMSVEGTIAGVGSGTLTIDVTWSSSRATGLEWRGTVVDGRGDFAGATGTLTIMDGGNVDDPATASVEVSGTYTLELEFGDTPDEVDTDASDTDAPNTAEGWSAVDPASELSVGLSARTLHPFEYWSDALGVPITFANPTALQLGAVDPGSIWLTSSGSSADVQGIALSRVGSWFTPEQAVDPTFQGLGSIDADAVDEWLDQHGIVVDQASDVTIGGRAAAVRSFTVPADHRSVFDDPSRCPWPASSPCFRADSASGDLGDQAAVDYRTMAAGWTYRLWLVDLGEFEPLMIRAYADPGDEQAATWLDDVVPAIVGSIELGEPSPVVPAGNAVRTVTLTGTSQAAGVVLTGADGVGEWTSTSTMTAEGVEFEAAGSGAFEAANTSWSDADNTTTMTGTIDGIGTGSITAVGRIERRGTVDATVDAVITTSTGAFEGATGTVTMMSDVARRTGTWSLTMSLPGDRFGDHFAEPPATDPILVPADIAVELTADGADGIADPDALAAGWYRTDLLGTPLLFETPEELLIWDRDAGRIVVGPNDPDGPSRGISISRVGSWYTPEEAVDPASGELGSIGADLIDFWMDANGLEVETAFRPTVSGEAAKYRAFVVPTDHPSVNDRVGDPAGNDPAGCPREEWTPCFWADSASADVIGTVGRSPWVLSPGSEQHVWLVDLGEFEPVLIRAWVDQPDLAGDDTTHWFDGVVPEIVGSIALGPAGPVGAG